MASRKRININMHSDTLLAMDMYRTEIGISRSNLIEKLVKNWIEEHELEKIYKVWPRPEQMTEDGYAIRHDGTVDVPF